MPFIDLKNHSCLIGLIDISFQDFCPNIQRLLCDILLLPHPPLHPSQDNRPAGAAEQSRHSSTDKMPLTALRLRTQTAATSSPHPELGVTAHAEGQGDGLAVAGPPHAYG